MKAQRTVTHLTSFPEGERTWPYVIAACDDGTIWAIELINGASNCQWDELPSIPGTQPEPEA